MASPNLNEITTTTLRNRSGKLADGVTHNNCLLRRLSEKGNVRPFSGGRTIIEEIEYQQNQTYTRYAGYQAINIAPSDVMTAAEFNISQAAVAVSISGLEELQNSGKEAVIDLLDARVKNAEHTFKNQLSTDCYSNGTASGGLQVGGLQLLVADAPTSGTVGGIDRATWTFWQNQKFGGVADGGAAVSSANIQDYMYQLWLKLVRYQDKPDLILADNNYWRFYCESLTSIQRITDSDKSASIGFPSLKFQTADVCFDGGFQGFSADIYGVGGSPANHMYFLNTDYIFFRPHRDRNMVPLNPDRFAVNQDAMVKLIAWAGQMTMSNAFLQGCLIA